MAKASTNFSQINCSDSIYRCLKNQPIRRSVVKELVGRFQVQFGVLSRDSDLPMYVVISDIYKRQHRATKTFLIRRVVVSDNFLKIFPLLVSQTGILQTSIRRKRRLVVSHQQHSPTELIDQIKSQLLESVETVFRRTLPEVGRLLSASHVALKRGEA